MKNLRNRYLFVADVFLLAAAAYGSFVLRLEQFHPHEYLWGLLLFSSIAIVMITLLFRQTGIYALYWRYASVEEMLLLVGAVTAGVAISGVLAMLAVWIDHAPILYSTVGSLYLCISGPGRHSRSETIRSHLLQLCFARQGWKGHNHAGGCDGRRGCGGDDCA